MIIMLTFTIHFSVGLLGRNGCGKSTFLKCLAAREVPIPDHFDIYLLAHEAPPSERTALEYVIDSAREEVARIEAEIERIMVEEGPDSEILLDLYDRLDELDPSTFESRASTILIGLGFKASAELSDGGSTIHKKTKDMSGGWRMRVSLSRALFIAPSILLLDEPTNHVSPFYSSKCYQSDIIANILVGFGGLCVVRRLFIDLQENSYRYFTLSRFLEWCLY